MILDETQTNDDNTTNKNITLPETTFDVESKVDILHGFTEQDYLMTEIPQRLTNFAFPSSIKVSSEFREPDFGGTLLADSYNNRHYCCVLIFWDKLSPIDILTMTETLNLYGIKCNRIAMSSISNTVYASKQISFISNYPFFNAFKTYLITLYRITTPPKGPIPLERFLMIVAHEIPMPPLGKACVQFMVDDNRNASNSLQLIYVNGLNLFRCLSVINLFNTLSEKKIVLINAKFHLILDVSETVLSLLYPLESQAVYMPILLQKLLKFLHSSVVVVVGVHSDWVRQDYGDVCVFFLFVFFFF